MLSNDDLTNRGNASEEARFDSLDLAYDEAKSLIQVQLEQIDRLDTKASTLLATSGLILSVLISGQALNIFFLAGQGIRPTVNRVDYVLLASASLFILISLVLGVMALRVRHYKLAPHPRTMREKYLGWLEDKAKLQILDNIVGAFEVNAPVISKKTTWLAYGFAFFAVGTALLVIIFVVTLARYWNTVLGS